MNIMSEKIRAPKKDMESPKDTNKFIKLKTTISGVNFYRTNLSAN